MMDALRRMKPTCIEDIVALVALYRPGPMENIPTYCEVKNGQRERASIHPLIDHILDETQGIIVYQEQVMQIAQVMAGYSLGGADLLRRAMGKKIKEAMDAERPKFIEGAKENGVDEEKASEVFDLLEKFANYGFNKSHAAAYAVVSYQTAWLKANHPVEFMAGVMNCDIHLTDKLAVYAEEVRRGLGIEIVPPCVNRSDATFTWRTGEMVYALGALKNVGVEAMRLIVAGRGERPFATLFDFARRVDLKRIGKRPLEMLARAGAFDELDRNRRRVFDGLDALVAYSAAVHDQREPRRRCRCSARRATTCPSRACRRWTTGCRPNGWPRRCKAIGFYLSGHPLDDYMAPLKRGRECMTLAEVTASGARRRRWSPRWPAPSRAGRSASRRAATASPSCSCRTRPGSTRSRCSPTRWRRRATTWRPGERGADGRGDDGERAAEAARARRWRRSTRWSRRRGRHGAQGLRRRRPRRRAVASVLGRCRPDGRRRAARRADQPSA